MLGIIFNFFLAVMGLILFAAGVLNIKEGIKKRNFGKSFCEGGGMTERMTDFSAKKNRNGAESIPTWYARCDSNARHMASEAIALSS